MRQEGWGGDEVGWAWGGDEVGRAWGGRWAGDNMKINARTSTMPGIL